MPHPPLIVANLIQVTVRQALGSTTPTNTFFVENNSGNSYGTELDGIIAIFNDFYLDIASELSTTWSITDYLTYDRSGAQQATNVTPPPVAVAGDDTGAIIPRQTALVVSLRTSYAGPRHRGRVYLCGFTEDKNDTAGVPAAAMVTVVQAAIDELISDLTANQTPLVVVSRGWEGPPNPPADWDPYATIVQTAVVDSRWDTQRRRALT